MSKATTIILIILAIVIVLVAGWYLLLGVNWANKSPTVGGQKDTHGCLVAAGYSWCQASQQCIRSWETYCTSATPKNVTFACGNGKTINAVFYPTDDKFVDLKLSDGRNLSVPHAISASGARYATANESLVFWNKGDAAFITENGATTYANCAIPGTPNTPVAQTVSDGTIAFTYNQNFGLATTPTQILVKSYIPPCDQNFNYCIYYNASTYKGTNFESAGLRIKKRTDLTNQSTCLNTPPSGFTIAPDSKTSTKDYSASIFRNVGQGAAGHTSSGSLYRLFIPVKNSCYEFETRIGQSEFGNYPPGSIKQFTVNDQNQVNVQLMNIVESITLSGGAMFQLPK